MALFLWDIQDDKHIIYYWPLDVKFASCVSEGEEKAFLSTLLGTGTTAQEWMHERNKKFGKPEETKMSHMTWVWYWN